MKSLDEHLSSLVIKPGQRPRLKHIDPEGEFPREIAELAQNELKSRARVRLQEYLARLSKAQELLWASDNHSILIVLQAMDAAGKDGTIKHVMSGVNPQGCRVTSFKRPSSEELDHDFLWRYVKELPSRGGIGIFNRSYYEDVLVVKVHPELLDTGKLPDGKRGKAFWRARYDAINALEKHLVESGTVVLKFFLHISKEEQRQRLLDRLEDPDKNWKFSTADVKERQFWDLYTEAFEDAIEATGTKWAPWHVIPANRKYIARTLIAATITHAIEALDLKWPVVSTAEKMELEAAHAELSAEGHVSRPSKKKRKADH